MWDAFFSECKAHDWLIGLVPLFLRANGVVSGDAMCSWLLCCSTAVKGCWEHK